MTLADIKKLNIPKASGSYQFYNAKGKLIYIGKAVDLRSRVYSYWRLSAHHTPAKARMVREVTAIKWITTESEIEALLLEANLVKKYQPHYNIDLRDDKRFYYIHISLEDEIPGVFLTRTIGTSGRYFGPFTSSLAVKNTLKAIRSLWPYCTMRRPQKKPCFYYQINRCLGPCGNKINHATYMKKVVKPLTLFLEGKKNNVIKEWQKEKKILEKKGDIEGAGRIEYLIRQIDQVLSHTRVLSVAEKYAADTVELAKVLGLKKVPDRIEGYDISNLFGKMAVGSLVVFRDGEPNKSQYRKFKIQLEKDVSDHKKGDVWMLEEMLERRFRHDWPLPDLIIIDGGKAQLNTAMKVLRHHHLTIMVIGISKGEGLRSAKALDKLYFPGIAKPLELSLASPAIHLIKRVRDEAHRFAITFHRDIRSKRFLGLAKRK